MRRFIRADRPEELVGEVRLALETTTRATGGLDGEGGLWRVVRLGLGDAILGGRRMRGSQAADGRERHEPQARAQAGHPHAGNPTTPPPAAVFGPVIASIAEAARGPPLAALATAA